jgi:hypothetical protein
MSVSNTSKPATAIVTRERFFLASLRDAIAFLIVLIATDARDCIKS